MKKKEKILLSIILLLVASTSFLSGLIIGSKLLNVENRTSTAKAEESKNTQQKQETDQKNSEMVEMMNQVLPANGLKTKISFGDAIIKMEQKGAIQKNKIIKLYQNRGGVPAELQNLLDNPSNTPITITKDNAGYLINLFWPLGIANKSLTLKDSDAGKPENVNDLASTGGWNLGIKENGGEYYNKFEIIKLTDEQDKLVKKVAQTIYRPCCDNSTAFPDCNHGAALLAVLQLGAAQGLSEEELYQEALKFNIFWFPDQYLKMALKFKYYDKMEWSKLDPKMLLSEKYSSSSGFSQNIMEPLNQLTGIVPKQSQGGGCSA